MPNLARFRSPPPATTPKRPPRALQVVRNPRSELAIAPIDWSQWYLTEQEDMGESTAHHRISRTTEEVLANWHKERGDTRTHVGGNAFFQWVQGEPNVQLSPDAFTLDRIPDPPPECFQTWLPGHLPPRLAVEVVSSNWRKDYDINPHKYAHLGCRELVIYDPDHDKPRHSKERVALQVYRRAGDGQFLRVYAGAGPAHCVEIGAWLVEVGSGSARELRVARDPAGLDLVPTLAETAQSERDRADRQQRLADQERVRAEQERVRAEQERAARLATDAENERLRAQLAQLRG